MEAPEACEGHLLSATFKFHEQFAPEFYAVLIHTPSDLDTPAVKAVSQAGPQKTPEVSGNNREVQICPINVLDLC